MVRIRSVPRPSGVQGNGQIGSQGRITDEADKLIQSSLTTSGASNFTQHMQASDRRNKSRNRSGLMEIRGLRASGDNHSQPSNRPSTSTDRNASIIGIHGVVAGGGAIRYSLSQTTREGGFENSFFRPDMIAETSTASYRGLTAAQRERAVTGIVKMLMRWDSTGNKLMTKKEVCEKVFKAEQGRETDNLCNKDLEKAFPLLMNDANEKLMDLAGIVVRAIDIEKMDKFVMINDFMYTGNSDVLTDDDYTKDALLVVVLAAIFMNLGAMAESALFAFLERMAIKKNSSHAVFGDVNQALKHYTSAGWLSTEKVKTADSATFSFSWGPRANAIVSKMALLEWVCEHVYADGRKPKDWTEQYRVANE